MSIVNITKAYKCFFCGTTFDIRIDEPGGIVVEDDEGNILLEYCPLCGTYNLVFDRGRQEVKP